jgi:hypothetical protein
MFTRARTIAPKKAGMNPRMIKPDTNRDANFNITALITKRNNPNVSIVIGKVKIFSINPIVALTKAITITAINAVPNPLISNPGMMCATIIKLNALKNQLTIKINIPKVYSIKKSLAV